MKDVSSLEDLIRQQALIRPNALMAEIDGVCVTYGEMDERTNRIANALAATGVGKDDRIALIDKNSLAFFETLFGARKGGAVQIAVNWRLSPAEIAYVLKDSGARLAFASSEFVEPLRQECAAQGVDLRFIVLDGPDADYPQWFGGFPADDSGYRSGPEDVALQLYTSGTTGRPKGAMLMNRSIFSFYSSAGDIFGRDSRYRHLNCLPLFHVGGINWSLQAMAYGSSVVAFREFDPEAIIRAISERQITHLMTVPAVVQLLLETPGVEDTDFSSLKGITYGGSTIPAHVLADAIATFGCDFYSMYGSTELSFGLTLLSPADHRNSATPDLLTSCGRPFPGTEIRIVDPISLQDLPEAQSGEIWVKSPQSAKGYWNNPVASAEVFLENGWYRTGDIGRLNSGYLYLTDRLNDMIISGGENVYPAEVERALNEHPAVRESAAFGIPDMKWGETVAAAVRIAADAQIDEQELIAFTRQRIAHYKAPRKILFLDEFPRTPSGKVQRNLLKKSYQESA